MTWRLCLEGRALAIPAPVTRLGSNGNFPDVRKKVGFVPIKPPHLRALAKKTPKSIAAYMSKKMKSGKISA